MKNSDYNNSLRDDLILFGNDKIPIYKGCKNAQCFCTGVCREVIGFETCHPFFKGSLDPLTKKEVEDLRCNAYEFVYGRVKE
jgi:hypothetical protein